MRVPALFLKLLVFLLPVTVNSQTGSIQVDDDLNAKLVFAEPVKSIISLSPHLTELVFESGAQNKLLATVEYADYPEAAKSILRVGSYRAWDLEKIMSLKPDLVLVWLSGSGIESVEKLRQLGLKVYVSEPRHLEAISNTIRDIGVMAGTSVVANQQADEFDQTIHDLTKRFRSSDRVEYFYQVWSEPLISINGRQLISRLFEVCGGENVFAHVPVLAPVISVEELLLANPEVIIGGARETDKERWLAQWKKWSALDAVKKDNLFFIDPDLLSRQTSRMLQGAEQVCLMLEKVREGRR